MYIALGPGLISGLSGGGRFERSNPALGGLLGVELPLGARTGLGFELNGDVELSGTRDRGSYTDVLFRVRLSDRLSRRVRLWGALGAGRAGYDSGAIVGSLAAGTSLMAAPKFGLDLSASLNWLGSPGDVHGPSPAPSYDGGPVLVIALRALFELHRGG